MYRAHGLASITALRPGHHQSPNSPQFTSRGLSLRTRLDIHRMMELNWPPDEIAQRVGVSRHAVDNVAASLRDHGCLRKPLQKALGARPKISEADGQALFDELVYSGWMYQSEMVRWLDIERGIIVNQATVSRYLRAHKWSRRTLRPFCINRNETLRESYRNCMRRYTAEDLVFLDESIFNEKTGWRHHAYAPIGHEARYTQEIKRGDTYAILPAYTVNHGYLPCTGIKKGYYNREEFIEWIETHLIPTLRDFFGNKPMVVILDNVSIHTNAEVTEVLERAGYVVRYLPPYSPDYNPIELTFAVLKAWIKRNYLYMRSRFPPGGFGEFLAAAIHESGCDRFAKKHFQYAAGGLYIDQEELDRARELLEGPQWWEELDQELYEDDDEAQDEEY
jgi:transposase